MPSSRLFALLLLLPPALAPAADRHWVFTRDCAGADWWGPASGSPSTCWSSSFGGQAGQSAPSAADDVFIIDPTPRATARVPLLLPGSTPTAVAAHSLLLRISDPIGRPAHSTVTLFARLRGLSTSVPRAQAVW